MQRTRLGAVSICIVLVSYMLVRGEHMHCARGAYACAKVAAACPPRRTLMCDAGRCHVHRQHNDWPARAQTTCSARPSVCGPRTTHVRSEHTRTLGQEWECPPNWSPPARREIQICFAWISK